MLVIDVVGDEAYVCVEERLSVVVMDGVLVCGLVLVFVADRVSTGLCVSDIDAVIERLLVILRMVHSPPVHPSLQSHRQAG